MINLLSKENNVIAKKEYKKRLAVVVGVALFVNLLIALVLILPAFYSLKLQGKGFQQQLDYSDQLFAKEGISEIGLFIKEINQQTSILKKGQDAGERKSVIIKKILGKTMDKIWIDGFTFSSELVVVSGNSETREDLRNFIRHLKGEEIFKDVDSPLSNFLKSEDIDFRVSIQL